MIAPMRAWVGRLALIAAALVPFVPAAAEFVRRGVPDYLFTGDGATLELRVLHAAHGTQLIGAYSRFYWSHPGPAFFYLALPLYEAFHERGPALNLFMLVVNAIVATAIVLLARRLRGDPFAWLVAALLAIAELVAIPFIQTGEWNPVSPMFPLVLLSFLGAALASGHIEMLPAFAFVASVIVQTHIGYLPEVAAVSAVAAAGGLWHLVSRQAGWHPQGRDRWIAVSTAAVLVVCWSLPLYESVRHRPGNLKLLMDFFAVPHRAEHTWPVVFATVSQGLAVVPMAIVQSWRIAAPAPGPRIGDAIALGELALITGALFFAWRWRDTTLGVFAAIALAEIVAAVAAVHAIRGEVLPYLVLWIAIPGLMAMVAGAAWLTPQTGRGGSFTIAFGAVALVLALIAPVPRAPIFRDREPTAEQLAHDVQAALAAHHVNRPVVRIASDYTWPAVAAIVLHLYKQRVPIFVERAWAFMFGARLVEDGQEHPSVLIGDRSFADRAREQPQLTPLAHSTGVFVFLEEAGFFQHHRLTSPVELVSIAGVAADAHVAVDGEIPFDGTPWNSAASVVLPTTSSSITVAVPKEAISGVFASVDGNDRYAVRCVGGPDLSWYIGVEQPAIGTVGMRTRLLFSDRVGECAAIQLAPASGDGSYSVAEIGFLRN